MTVMNWAKKHVVTALTVFAAGGGLVGTAAGSVGTYYLGLQQSRVDRFSDSLMEQYKGVADSKRELYAAVDTFTMSIARGTRPDQSVVEDLNHKLLDLHERLDIFSLGLDDQDRRKLGEVKTALANMKIEAAQVKTKADLPYFAGRLAQFETAYQAARPIVEKKIGKPNEVLAG